MKRVRIKIYGKVQGVFFRANTRRRANKANIKGYIKNMRDGTVEAIFEGESKAVNNLIEWCKKGPEEARVDKIELNEEPYSGKFESFKIKYY